jgi:hypothetical protein
MSTMTPNGEPQPDDPASAAETTAPLAAVSTGASAAEPKGLSNGQIATRFTGGIVALALVAWGFYGVVGTRSEGGWGSTISKGDANAKYAVGVGQGVSGDAGIVPNGDPALAKQIDAIVSGGAAASEASRAAAAAQGAAANANAHPVLGGGAPGTPGATTGIPPATVQNAMATCTAALGNAEKTTTANGTTATIGDWAIKATSSVDALRTEAATLEGNVATADQGTIAIEANQLCTSITSVGQLPAMPDAAGSAAWQSALTSFAQGASDALKGSVGDTASKTAATNALQQGAAHLTTLSARIISATA